MKDSCEPEMWTRPVAESIARATASRQIGRGSLESDRLSPRYYSQYGAVPPLRILAQRTGINAPYLRKLFPCGLVNGACKIAGFPRSCCPRPDVSLKEGEKVGNVLLVSSDLCGLCVYYCHVWEKGISLCLLADAPALGPISCDARAGVQVRRVILRASQVVEETRSQEFLEELPLRAQRHLLSRRIFRRNKSYWSVLLPWHLGFMLIIAFHILCFLAALAMVFGLSVTSGSPDAAGRILYYLILFSGASSFILGTVGSIGVLVKRLSDRPQRFCLAHQLFQLRLHPSDLLERPLRLAGRPDVRRVQGVLDRRHYPLPQRRAAGVRPSYRPFRPVPALFAAHPFHALHYEVLCLLSGLLGR